MSKMANPSRKRKEAELAAEAPASKKSVVPSLFPAASSSDQHRRERHRASEQRRREKLNLVIQELSELLPESFTERVDKVSIVSQAVTYTKELKNLSNKLLQDTQELLVDNNKLKLEVASIRNYILQLSMDRTPSSGSSLSSFSSFPSTLNMAVMANINNLNGSSKMGSFYKEEDSSNRYLHQEQDVQQQMNTNPLQNGNSWQRSPMESAFSSPVNDPRTESPHMLTNTSHLYDLGYQSIRSNDPNTTRTNRISNMQSPLQNRNEGSFRKSLSMLHMLDGVTKNSNLSSFGLGQQEALASSTSSVPLSSSSSNQSRSSSIQRFWNVAAATQQFPDDDLLISASQESNSMVFQHQMAMNAFLSSRYPFSTEPLTTSTSTTNNNNNSSSNSNHFSSAVPTAAIPKRTQQLPPRTTVSHMHEENVTDDDEYDIDDDDEEEEDEDNNEEDVSLPFSGPSHTVNMKRLKENQLNDSALRFFDQQPKRV